MASTVVLALPLRRGLRRAGVPRRLGTAVVAASALAGAASYLFYYKGISVIGAARGMALNITYSAWAVVFGVFLLGAMPTVLDVVCCVAIMCGTVLAATDWRELFGRCGEVVA